MYHVVGVRDSMYHVMGVIEYDDDGKMYHVMGVIDGEIYGESLGTLEHLEGAKRYCVLCKDDYDWFEITSDDGLELLFFPPQ